MALIRSLQPDPHAARPPRTEVDCLFSTVYTDGGGRLLRLATLGSDHRKLHPKPSQIIEFDQTVAEELLKVMLDTFPTMRVPPRSS